MGTSPVSAQTLIIDGTDFSDYIQQMSQVGISPIYTNGANVGETDSGIQIFDRARVRYALSFALKPLPQSLFQTLIAACEANSVPVVATTPRYAVNQSFVAQISLSSFSYATNSQGERIYSGATIEINPR